MLTSLHDFVRRIVFQTYQSAPTAFPTNDVCSMCIASCMSSAWQCQETKNNGVRTAHTQAPSHENYGASTLNSNRKNTMKIPPFHYDDSPV